MSLEMKTISGVVQSIFKDNLATLCFLLGSALCAVNFFVSWTGFITFFILIGAVALSTFVLRNFEAKRTVQNALTTILNIKLERSSDFQDDTFQVQLELDEAIESFFEKVIKNFISIWFESISRDETFLWNLKYQISVAVRSVAIRMKKADHAKLLSNKLLPVVYSHLDVLSRINHTENSIEAFIDNKNPIHPATFNRNAEITYLRQLSQRLLSFLISSSNKDSKVIVDLLKEVLTHTFLLPLMDIISDPGQINYIVILATNPKVQQTLKKLSGKKVILLENFVKKVEPGDESSDDDSGANFLKDQDKLYCFMQHLKSKNSKDIELLKFYLDVISLDDALQNSNVISDPTKLSEMQQKSEKLLTFYQENLIDKDHTQNPPNDLIEAHEEARKLLETKWKNDFYKSAEYFQLIYGDKETIYADNLMKSFDYVDSSLAQQKFSTKIKNAMTLRTGTVEGLSPEISIWDASSFDHPLGSSSYYNSMAVKMRKERGQDLDGFMQSFFHSIEQEADVGEDIATQLRDESRKRRLPILLGNNELYKNLFNIPTQSKNSEYSVDSHVKTAADSVIYFLDSILKLHKVLMKLISATLQFLPDSENIVLHLIRNLLHKVINENVLADLVKDLEEKVFDSKPTSPSKKEELQKRQKLAEKSIESINKNLVDVLKNLQNPLFNKNLFYFLVDLLIVELFPELKIEK